MASPPASAQVRKQMLLNVALFLLTSALHIAERTRTGKPLTQLVVTVIVGGVLVGVFAWQTIRRGVPVRSWIYWAGVVFMGYLAAAAAYRIAAG